MNEIANAESLISPPKADGNISGWAWPALLLVSILFADLKLTHDSFVLYPPEIVIYLWIIAITISHRSLGWITSNISRLPRLILWGTALILLGAIVGTIVSPLFPQSLGALKSWVITPLLFSLIVLEVKPTEKQTITWMLSLAAGWILIGLLGFDYAHPAERLKGFFESANYFSILTGPLFVWLYVTARKNRYLIFGVVLLLLGIELVLTRSIGGLLGIAVAVTLFEVFSARERRRLLTISIGLLFLIILGLASQRLSSERNSFNTRTQIWRVAGEMIIRQPLTGPGLRGFESKFPALVNEVIANPIEVSAAQPHNLLLSYWINAGVFGFAGLLMLGYWVYRHRQLASGATWALLAIFVHGLIDTPYWRLDFALMFWVYICLMVVSCNEENCN